MKKNELQGKTLFHITNMYHVFCWMLCLALMAPKTGCSIRLHKYQHDGEIEIKSTSTLNQ